MYSAVRPLFERPLWHVIHLAKSLQGSTNDRERLAGFEHVNDFRFRLGITQLRILVSSTSPSALVRETRWLVRPSRWCKIQEASWIKSSAYIMLIVICLGDNAGILVSQCKMKYKRGARGPVSAHDTEPSMSVSIADYNLGGQTS